MSASTLRCAGSVAIAFATFLSACISGPEQPSENSAAPRDQLGKGACGQAVTASEPNGGTAAPEGQAIYSSGGELWLYDVSSDSATLLTTAGSSIGLRPRFRDARSVSFAGLPEESETVGDFDHESLYEIDLRDRQVTEILKLPRDLSGYDWSPDGRWLAYQMVTRTGPRLPPMAVCLYDSIQGTTTLLRSLKVPFLTGLSQQDEESVAWSPQGESILVIDTHQRPSVYILDREGRDLVPPLHGTFARWLPDGKTVLYREERESADKPGRWLTLDVISNRTQRLGIPADASKPAISPNGEMMVYDDGDEERPSTYTYVLADGTRRRLIRGHGAPIWFGPNLIAATAAGPCPPRMECNNWWVEQGRTVGIDLDNGTRRQLELPTTLQEPRVFSTIDVFTG